ncbi:MAG: transposase family protein, partial [Planctomycetes bacterium]|nr:transposase family protein [Planctomycetota bacterium]
MTCYVCWILDDHARNIIRAAIGTATSSAWVVELLQSAFAQFGKPEQIVTDNGQEFVSRWED